MTRRKIRRAKFPPAVEAAHLRRHARLGPVSKLDRDVRLAVAAELKRQNEEQARTAAVAARRG